MAIERRNKKLGTVHAYDHFKTCSYHTNTFQRDIDERVAVNMIDTCNSSLF